MARASVTFQVLEGIDRGRVYRELPIPVSIGREEGNTLRLNDERVSRFHAKVQVDDDDYILTDLESTNGTRVNGTAIQIRRLRVGDRVGVGRSLLLFGSNEEIAARMASLAGVGATPSPLALGGDAELLGEPNSDRQTLAGQLDLNLDFDVNLAEPARLTSDALFIGTKALPPLPLKMTPSQAARLAEILDYLHQGLTQATENIQAKDDGTQVTLDYTDWQRVVAIQMLLARYLRLVADPPEMDEKA
ncbi:MAG: FHA domain-containing protein [Planctomycetes bacterium]|nr:FHA domain-containing protein [Planctomycetota bacterium]